MACERNWNERMQHPMIHKPNYLHLYTYTLYVAYFLLTYFAEKISTCYKHQSMHILIRKQYYCAVVFLPFFCCYVMVHQSQIPTKIHIMTWFFLLILRIFHSVVGSLSFQFVTNEQQHLINGIPLETSCLLWSKCVHFFSLN